MARGRQDEQVSTVVPACSGKAWRHKDPLVRALRQLVPGQAEGGREHIPGRRNEVSRGPAPGRHDRRYLCSPEAHP